MTKNSQFIRVASENLNQLDDELSDLQMKIVSAGKADDEWANDQVGKLKLDLKKAKTEMKTIVRKIESEGDASIEDAKIQAERHWEALRAAVKAYRGYLEKTVAN